MDMNNHFTSKEFHKKFYQHAVCTREEFQDALGSVTGCGGQHDGWSCNSCFHTTIDLDYGKELKEDVHDYWEAVLAFRGDYPDLPPRLDLVEEIFWKMGGSK